MNHPHQLRTAGRARWLTQLTAALDEAQHLLSQLMVNGNGAEEASRLRATILALSCEIELLRGEGFIERRNLADRPPANWR